MTTQSERAAPERKATLRDQTAIAQWSAISEGYQAVNKRIHKAFEGAFSLNPAESDTVLHLASADQMRLPMAALARAVDFSTGGFTKIADRLERRGLVQRLPCADDRRVTYLELTESGREIANEAQCLMGDFIRLVYTDVIGDKNAEIVVDAMTRVRDANSDRA